MDQFHVILVMPSYGLIPVPPHLRHLTILSPFLRVPFPSQFLHFCFFCPVFFRTQSSKVDRRSSRTFFKRSLAIVPSFNDPERDPLMFLQIGPLHVIVRRLAPALRPSSTRPLQPRRQRPRAALPVSSRLKHGAHRCAHSINLLFTSIIVEFRFVPVPAPLSGLPATLALRPNPNFSLPPHGHVATTEFEKQISWG
jgi:hypothetical protein